MTRQKAYCPYCKGTHYSKRAFNKCKRQNAKFKWTAAGKKTTGGK